MSFREVHKTNTKCEKTNKRRNEKKGAGNKERREFCEFAWEVSISRRTGEAPKYQLHSTGRDTDNLR
jgi:hypothetical protein